jgi:hypothetical protein
LDKEDYCLADGGVDCGVCVINNQLN